MRGFYLSCSTVLLLACSAAAGRCRGCAREHSDVRPFARSLRLESRRRRGAAKPTDGPLSKFEIKRKELRHLVRFVTPALESGQTISARLVAKVLHAEVGGCVSSSLASLTTEADVRDLVKSLVGLAERD